MLPFFSTRLFSSATKSVVSINSSVFSVIVTEGQLAASFSMSGSLHASRRCPFFVSWKREGRENVVEGKRGGGEEGGKRLMAYPMLNKTGAFPCPAIIG